MKKLLPILLALLLLPSCNSPRQHFAIIPGEAFSDTLSLAVQDLASYLVRAVPGAEVEMGADAPGKGNVIRVVRNEALGWNGYRISSAPGEDGCYVYTLEGADIWGLQYAVYDLAERLLGVQYLKPELDYIPEQRHFRPFAIDTGIQSPDYRWRGLYPWHYNYNSRGLDSFCDINRRFVDGDWDWYRHLCDWMVKNRQNAVLWFDDVFSHENISGQFPAEVQDYFALRGIRQILGLGWASNEDLQSKDVPVERPYCMNQDGKSVEDAAWKRNICPLSETYFPLADINFSRMDLSRPDNYLGCLIGYGENGWAAKEEGTDCVLQRGVPSSRLMARDYRYIRSKLDGAGLENLPLGFVTSTWSIHPGNPFETDAFLDALPEGSIFTMHSYQQTGWKQFERLYRKIEEKDKGFKVFHIAEVAFLCGCDIPLLKPSILRRRALHFDTLPRKHTIGHLATLNTTQYLYWLMSWQEMRWQWNREDTRIYNLFPEKERVGFNEILDRLLCLENVLPYRAADSLKNNPRLTPPKGWGRYDTKTHPSGFGFLLQAGLREPAALDEALESIDRVLALDSRLQANPLYRTEFSATVRLTAQYYAIRAHYGKQDYGATVSALDEYNRIAETELGIPVGDGDFVENPDRSYLVNLEQ